MSEQDGNNDQSFNDDELQDIMNEIESLEREFVEEEKSLGPSASESDEDSDDSVDEPTAEEEQETTEASGPEHQEHDSESSESEVPESSAEEPEPVEEPAAEAEHQPEEDNVVPMTRSAQPAPSADSSGGEGYMQFSGQGNMDMQLNFQIGSETATLNVRESGLYVTLAGVDFKLTENGCEVEMEGGVRFSVPLTGQKAKGKKAA